MKITETIKSTGLSKDKTEYKVKTSEHSEWIYFPVSLIHEDEIQNHKSMLGMSIIFNEGTLKKISDYFVIEGWVILAKPPEHAPVEKVVKAKVAKPKAKTTKAAKESSEEEQEDAIVIIPKKFDYKNIYDSMELKRPKVLTMAKNKKLEDLLNQTLNDNAKTLFYRSVAKGRALNFSDISLFDDGLTSEFLMGTADTLKLKVPKYLGKEISIETLEKKYSGFYSKKDLELFIAKLIMWSEFALKINQKIESRYQMVKMISDKAIDLKRETGNWVFYAAWPFIEGRTTSSKVRTPFMFTPIEVSYEAGSYIFKRTPKPIKINSQLIQTVYTENKRIPTNLNIYFDSVNDLFREYAKHGITFENQLGTLKNLPTIQKDDFGKNIEPNSFTLSNISIFENIIKSDDIYNDVLKIYQKYNEFSLPDVNINVLNRDDWDKEEFKLLPFDIDKNKNNVVSAALKTSLTIFGPPGTGKSEVITSILVKSLAEGNTNLVVSEKDAALSVLMSRLKLKYDFDIFALKLNGNTMTNKNLFWSKIEAAIKNITAWNSEMFSEYPLEENFLDSAQKLNQFKGEIEKSGISEEKFIENIKLINNLFAYAKTDNLKISNHIREVNKSLKIYFDVNHSIDTLIARITAFNEKLDKYNTDLKKAERKIERLLNPPIAFLAHSAISLEALIRFRNNHKAMLKYLSNKHYSVVTFGKAYKENQHKLLEIQETAKKIVALKVLGLNFVLPKKISDATKELEKLRILKEKISKDILREEFSKVEHTFDIKPAAIDELQKMQDIYVEFYAEKLDDTHALYKKFKEDSIGIFQNAKKVYKANTVRYIVDKINFDANLHKKFRGLNRLVGYGNKSRPKPGFTLQKYFDIISVIFPIIIATPNEVSRYIPHEADSFDYGIFDEASQMFIHRGLPSVHRCKKVIIAGDEKQLSPTNWFKSSVQADLEEDYDYDEDGLEADSLLTWGKGRFKRRLLDVHYRSQSSKLIEYSNVAFYNGELKSIDTPYAKSNPIELITLNGVWKNGVNKQEAQAVVEKLKESLNLYDSMGVITVNKTQQTYIINLIEKDEHLSNIYHSEYTNRLFVKNIENVQGDEADMIIFSTAYAPVDGVMKVGNLIGLTPNRLNVAITRAKRKMVVFNSFKSSELGIGSEGTGKNTLYKWIKWLEANAKNQINSMADLVKYFASTFKSPFEEEFFRMFQNHLPKHLIARANFISNGYEINIVIFDLIQDKFVGAIELDGASYYYDPADIERNFQKTNFLEALGWNIVRVSLTGYWKNKEKSVELAYNRLMLK